MAHENIETYIYLYKYKTEKNNIRSKWLLSDPDNDIFLPLLFWGDVSKSLVII